MVNIKDIYWLAGYLEGEGCFHARGNSPTIDVGSTDYDAIKKVANLVKSRVTILKTAEKKDGSIRKKAWRCRIYGFNAIGWMMTLFFLMGKRRQEKIGKVIKKWRKCFRIQVTKNYRKNAICHPERKYLARGFCRQCYEKEWKVSKRTGQSMKRLYV